MSSGGKSFLIRKEKENLELEGRCCQKNKNAVAPKSHLCGSREDWGISYRGMAQPREKISRLIGLGGGGGSQRVGLKKEARQVGQERLKKKKKKGHYMREEPRHFD